MSPPPRLEPKLQPMPLDRSILWNPSMPGAKQTEGTSRAPYPIFFQQEAVIALQEHVKGSPTQAIFGFLVGDLYRDPESGALYTVIDKTLKLSQTIYGDKTEVVVARLWERMQEQLKKAAGLLLGWYHSHPGQGGLLTAHDIETHEKFFTDPWHVAILVAAEAGGVTGKFFRITQGNDDWHKTPLAFHELLQPESIKPDGKKRSYITWRNYKAYGPSLQGPKPKPKEEPKAEEPEEEEVEAEAPREAPPPPEREKKKDKKEKEKEKKQERGFRIMRSSADDIPLIKTSADDEPAPPPRPEPPPPPPPAAKARPAEPKPPPPPPPKPPEPPPAPPPQRTPEEFPWTVTPESIASIPPEVAAPRAPAPLPPRRPSGPKFRLLDQEHETKAAPPKPRRRRHRGPWLKRLVTILVIGAIGAGGYWFLAPRWTGLVNQAKQLVSKITTRKSPPRAAAGGSRRQATPPAPPPVAVRPAPAPPPAVPPLPPPAAVPPPVAASPFARFDRLSDSLSRAVRNFHDRAALFASGRMDCNGLASGLVAMENLWITYNTERRARMAAFDQQRATQDQAMYAAVDSAESSFERSGCPRP